MKYFVPAVFVLAAIAGLWLIVAPNSLSARKNNATPQVRVVSPKNESRGSDGPLDEEGAERLAFEDVSNAKIALSGDESAVTIITQDFDGDPQDEQVIAIKKNEDSDEPVRLIYADFDENSGGYKRGWEAATAATKPRTFSMFVKDLIGDRSFCIVAMGMNNAGEQTMTVFRKFADKNENEGSFQKIAELKTDGSISVTERDRSQAYQLGIASGASYRISTYGRDFDSSNLLDQIETIYDYDETSGRYERAGVARIAGAQVEQRRVRQLLDGSPDRFIKFLDGLWQFAPTTTDDASAPRQYIHFDPLKREVIFYTDDTQEVFTWENSSATRYGLYLTTQNISVTTLRRLIDIELESADAIRVKVFEDVKLKIGIGGRWDGTYRKAGEASVSNNARRPFMNARQDAEYRGIDGTLKFYENGKYEFVPTGTDSQEAGETGVYAFFPIDDGEFLELRKDAGSNGEHVRAVYQVERTGKKPEQGNSEEIILVKVRLGVSGVENLHEKELVLRRSNAKTTGTIQTPRP